MATKKQTKMTTFQWEGMDKKGRKVKGDIDAPSQAFVNATLRRQGIKPTKVKRQSKSLGGSKKIKSKEIAMATRQLATMIEAGIPVSQCIAGIARGHENPSVQKLFNSIRQDVEGGSTMAQAMSKHPKYFDKLYCNLVDAGEQSGTLDRLLDRIAIYLEKIEAGCCCDRAVDFRYSTV